MQALTQSINDYCVDNEIKVKDFAKLVGIQDSLIYKYINEKSIPTVNNIVKLANFFSCSIDFLVGLDTNFTSVKPANAHKELFYPRYCKLLDKKQITHYELSNKIDIAKSSLLAWKNGTTPYLNTLIEIAKFFEVSVDYLVGRSDIK